MVVVVVGLRRVDILGINKVNGIIGVVLLSRSGIMILAKLLWNVEMVPADENLPKTSQKFSISMPLGILISIIKLPINYLNFSF